MEGILTRPLVPVVLHAVRLHRGDGRKSAAPPRGAGWFGALGIHPPGMVRLTLPRLSRGADPEPDRPDPVARLMEHASEADRRIVEEALQHSMTGPVRLLALVDAVRYCHSRRIR